ncbi:hypothetical protein FOZ63_006159 [Perkinsus olseni]|uniref:Uncharacterized protein n=1 Tax=Perkinsus olseni TaxID=32597 RepID=A0A7J6UNT5_PEROL|nr:hypothetical protein FOZ62_013491 [Perkinsus olseni]KAF4758892.1 hypothetical protein FOZ63_006159 [Perkinsus olseni]
MSATPEAKLGCGGNPKRKRSSNSTILANIVFVSMMTLVCADAIMGEDSADRLIRDPLPRYPEPYPVIVESSPNCLPPRGTVFKQPNHCWFIRKGPDQANGGALFASNNSGYTAFATMELGVKFGADGSLSDVFVWAAGRTIWLFYLPAGISVGVDLYLPTFSKGGGYPYLGGKRLDFPIWLKTRVTIPYFGVVRAENNATAYATVGAQNTTYATELRATVRTQGTNGIFSSSIESITFIVPEQEQCSYWNFTSVITTEIEGKLDELSLSYYNTFPIFDGTI